MRPYLESGPLKRWVKEEEVMRVSSNPTSGMSLKAEKTQTHSVVGHAETQGEDCINGEDLRDINPALT